RTKPPLANNLREHFGKWRRRSQRLHTGDASVGADAQLEQDLASANRADWQRRWSAGLQLRGRERLLRRERDRQTTARHQQCCAHVIPSLDNLACATLSSRRHGSSIRIVNEMTPGRRAVGRNSVNYKSDMRLEVRTASVACPELFGVPPSIF